MSELKVAIVGCGGMAGAHARRWKANPEVKIVALCDVRVANAEGLIQRRLEDYRPAPAIFDSDAKMYRAADLDGVAIVTPHTLHFEQAMRALDAGCHVLVEKPMVTSTKQAYALAEKVEKAGKVLVVGYNTSYSPNFAYLRDAIRKGTFGRLEMVHGYLSQNWKKATAGSWRHEPALSGGGQAYDSGQHLLNSLCWSIESRVAEVFAVTDRQDTAVDINASILVRFENGVLATVAIGGNCASNGTHTVFIFEGGRVDIDGWGGGWIKAFKGDQEIKDLAIDPAPYTVNDNFVDAIRGRAEPRVPVRSGVVQCELMDAVYESANTGKPVRPA